MEEGAKSGGSGACMELAGAALSAWYFLSHPLPGRSAKNASTAMSATVGGGDTPGRG